MIISGDELRAQLNETPEADADLLERLAESAQSHMESLLGYRIEDRYGGNDQDDTPPALKQAALMLAAHWYENREASIVGVTAQSLPIGVDDIIRQFRDYSWGEEA